MKLPKVTGSQLLEIGGSIIPLVSFGLSVVSGVVEEKLLDKKISAKVAEEVSKASGKLFGGRES